MQHRYEFVRGKKHFRGNISNNRILSQTLDRTKCIIVAQDRLLVTVVEGKEIVYMKNTCKMIRIE